MEKKFQENQYINNLFSFISIFRENQLGPILCTKMEEIRFIIDINLNPINAM